MMLVLERGLVKICCFGACRCSVRRCWRRRSGNHRPFALIPQTAIPQTLMEIISSNLSTAQNPIIPRQSMPRSLLVVSWRIRRSGRIEYQLVYFRGHSSAFPGTSHSIPSTPPISTMICCIPAHFSSLEVPAN